MGIIAISKLFFSFLISFLVTFHLIPLVCEIAKKWGIIDIPDGKIKQHTRPTPYLGGVAVYGGFITALALVIPFENKILLLLVGATVLLLLGLFDDLLAFKHYQKFFGQIIAAFCFLKAGLFLKTSFFMSNVWRIPISLLWILTIINAFNLVDVMDGLAVSLAFFSSFSFLIIAYNAGDLALGILLCAFLGSLSAFFMYNKPPAYIYLGDAGSLFIGGLLAAIPFLYDWGEYTYFGYLTPIIILSLPLLEVSDLIVIRTFKGIPFYNPSPDHFSIYLQQKGWSKYKILIYVWLLSLVLLGTSLSFIYNYLSFVCTLILAIFFIIIWFWNLL